MIRKRKFDRQTQAGEPVRKLLETIVENIAKAAKMPHDDWWALSQSPLVPLAIPISDGSEYRTTQTGVETAHKLTGQIWEQREDIRQRISGQAFKRISFLAIGRSIQSAVARLPEEAADSEASDEIESVFYDDLAADFRKSLDGLVEKAGRDVDQHIPCELFHADQLVSAFSVGPVEFRPRSDWIAQFVKDPKARNIVEQVERRELMIDDVRRRATELENGRALRDARTAITCLRGVSWVGTVRTAGHEFGQSHWKSSILVGLAINAVGLRFHPEEARRLRRAGHGHLGAEYRLATSVDDGRFIHGWSTHLPGLGSAPGALENRIQEEREFLNAAGRILDVYAEHRQEGDAPVLVERWVNALHWVGEARREVHDFMATVKYGCAVDMISGGGGSRAITSFVEAALERRDGGEQRSGPLSVADAVEMVYREGRSRLAHGGTPGLLEDFSKRRRVGDALLASLFYPVTLALAELIAEGSPALTSGRKIAFRALEVRMQNMIVGPQLAAESDHKAAINFEDFPVVDPSEGSNQRL